jgi:hypothetical protein
MATIAIIDDNTEQSGTVKTNLEIELSKIGSDLEVITSVPFANPNDYFNFIDKNEICVLILDEKLNDRSNDNNAPVDYLGSDLVTALRRKLKEFPIFAITNFVDETELKEKYSEFEDIIIRKQFLLETEKYFPKIWRSAKNYLNENIDEFSQFNQLTMEIAGGNKDPVLIAKLKALQVKLELPFSGFDDRNAWLNEYESQIDSLEKLIEIFKSKLDDKK